MINSYSLEEVAAQHLPPHWDGVRWLRTRIGRGEIKAKKISRGVYRMTDAQIATWLAGDSTAVAAAPIAESESVVTPIVGGLSQRSQRRRAVSA